MVRHELVDSHRVVGSLYQLAVAVVVGVVVYTTALIGIWLVAGRPRGAEALMFERAGQVASGLRRVIRQATS
jgi:hypothetical protein